MSDTGNERAPECAILCRLSPENRSECPGALSTFVTPPTAASKTVATFVELCQNPANAGTEPVFGESWDDGADSLTIFGTEMPDLDTLHKIIDSSRNF
jgi:hypothetical protein